MMLVLKVFEAKILPWEFYSVETCRHGLKRPQGCFFSLLSKMIPAAVRIKCLNFCAEWHSTWDNVGLQVPFILPRGSSFPLLPVNPLLLLRVLFVRQVICADCNHLRRWRLLSNLGPVFETFKDWNHLRKVICDLNVKLCWCCFLKIDTHLRTTYCKFSFKATTFLSEDNNASFENWAPGVQNRFAYSAVVARNRDCRQSCSLA